MCDNEGTVVIINKGRTKCPQIKRLMRTLVIKAALSDFLFSAQ